MILIFFFKHKQHEMPIVLFFIESIKVYYPVLYDKIPNLSNCLCLYEITNIYLTVVPRVACGIIITFRTLRRLQLWLSTSRKYRALTVEDGLKHVITHVVLGKTFIIFGFFLKCGTSGIAVRRCV